MNPQSKSRIPTQIRQQFFNDSFYHQKIQHISSAHQINDSTYISYQFVKRYFQATKINQLINRAVRTTLQSPYLPQNPYNMIGRLLLHQCILQNMKAYFFMIPPFDHNDPNTNQQISQRMLADLKIGNNYYTIGWKLANFVRIQRVSALWALLFQPKSKRIRKQHYFETIYGLGGSLILKIGSPYSAEQSVTPIIIVKVKDNQSTDYYQQFADFIIDDCIQICQSSTNIFMKLYIYSHQKTSTQWSSDHLIHNRTKVTKQIYKSCISTLNQIKVQFLIKVPQSFVKILGTMYLHINKTYLLVQQDADTIRIHSIQPITLLFNAIFNYQSTNYQNIVQSFGTVQQLTHQMFNQLHNSIIYALQQQQPSWIGWYIFFLNLYDVTTPKNKQLLLCINFLINSPLTFIDDLKHQIRVAKILSSKYQSITYEQQIITIIQKCEKKIKKTVQKQQHVYPQTIIYFKAIIKNLQLILQTQTIKSLKNIKFILSKLQIFIQYLLNSFYQICLVLKGHLLNSIVKIDNQFGKDGSGQVISTTVTYDIFLRKYKDLPQRTLNIPEQIQKLKSTIYRPDEDLRQLILAKYVKNYKLYQKIYQFYWTIICGKKLTFPMGQFVTLLRNQAIRFQYKPMRKRKNKFEVQQTKIDAISIYKRPLDARGEHLFFALNSEILQDQNALNYRPIKEIFQQYFSQKSSKNLSSTFQKNTYIISICSSISRIKSQQSDFNKCKIYVDSIYHPPIKPTQINRLIYQQILQKLQMLNKNGFGVIGIYNSQKQFLDQDQVIPWTQHQQKYDINFLRYHQKKIFSLQSLTKLIKNCKTYQSQILLRGIFWLNGLLKNCQISFNFLINKQWTLNPISTYKTRVFSSHQDITHWIDYSGLKPHLHSSKQLISQPSQLTHRESIKQNYMNNHIDLITFIASDLEQPLDPNKLRTYSPFYNQLQQALSLVETLFYLLQFVKIDKQSKFQVKDFKTTVEILEYYLFDRCLRMDRYIYSQGLSVTIINLVSYIHRYLNSHEDNNGEEKQLICLQKITIKLMNCIHYVLVSCAFGVMEAIQSQFINEKSELAQQN